METVAAPLYDFPKYYDLVYGSDWKAEFDFLEGCFERYTDRVVERLFEPACGTGRLLYRFAKVGYDAAGLDLNPKAIAFCNERLVKHGLPPSAFVGDMSDFKLRRKVDAAFNTINSFRHLQTHAQAVGHLRCMASCIARGGLYVLGLHLTPTAVPPMEEESWAARRGNLAVLSRVWVVEHNRRKRQERVGMSFDVYTPTRQLRIVDETAFRTYTAPQMRDLLAEVPEFEIVAIHDFGYDLSYEVVVTAATEDVVYVLRRR
ncbi:MAG: class I SAM-dependent methyltransferase [Pirellulales bacterium]|nr:class I SAM-dependent methyltransferase [Pirellulales bacterium]